MPLFTLNEDYKGWKAGVTVRLCSQDHLEAMGRGIGIEVQEPKPKSKVKVKIESIDNATAKVAEAKEAIKAIKKPEVPRAKAPEDRQQPDKPKPKGTPALPKTYNARKHDHKSAGKKKK